MSLPTRPFSPVASWPRTRRSKAAIPALEGLEPKHSPLGLGTWPLTGKDAETAVATAIEAGYRLIDTAARYENEEAIARGIAATGLPRRDVRVTTKLRGCDHVSGNIRAAVERSLENLGGHRIDLYLIHWPLPRYHRFVSVYEELLTLREEGFIDQVGVSNFKPAHINQLVAATGVTPAVNQIQLDPRHARHAAQEFHKSLGITTQAWSPLKDRTLFAEPVVQEAAAKHGSTPAQVVLAWHIRQGVAPLVMSQSPGHQQENLGAVDVLLDDADMGAIRALDLGEHAARDSDIEEWM